MSLIATHRIAPVLALAGIVAVAGCSQSSPSPASPSSPASVGSLNGNAPPPGWVDVFPRQANSEAIEVCKVYVGTIGPAVTITVAADIGNNGSVDQTYTVTLSHNQCRDVWLSENPGDTVTVTETVPAGYTVSYVKQTFVSGTLTNFPSVQSNSASGLLANGSNGALIIFTNSSTPPPPPEGEGCTPGYWKNHLDSWQGFSPSANFDTVFGLGTPGMFTPNRTLLQALQNGGGQFDKLGRHATAALLNAAHSGVDFGMTTAQVISAVQAAFAAGNAEPLAGNLALLNEAGCRLN